MLLALFSPTVWAADLSKHDFAYGLVVKLPPKTAVAALSLPDLVYRSAYRTDLGDIRVFNASGESVPHMIRYAQTRPEETRWQPLTFYPLPELVRIDGGGYRVFVRTSPTGAVVKVDPFSVQEAPGPIRHYLVDVSQVSSNLQQLRLEWQTGAHNRMTPLAVDTSDDLDTWKTLQERSTIADIRYGGRRLRRNIIALAPGSKRYLRLRQLDSGQAVTLLGIEGRFKPAGRFAIRANLKLSGNPAANFPGTFVYRTNGTFPVDRVNLLFDQANSMADALIESRPDEEATWTRRLKNLFYRIDVDSPPLTNAPRALAITMDRHWRVTVEASDSTIGNAVPDLELGFRPHDFFFIARGRGPFTLAFGSATVQPLKSNVASLFAGIQRQQKDSLASWVSPQSRKIVLGGPQRLLPAPQPLPLRRILLWSILVLGVLVVAALAWRLSRRMKAMNS